jgi:CheY-like chemotaxis protein/anti-sigma regulatory factor (Ser/Thr protein kinase)
VRRLARWSDPPAGDPHRDVTGALHDISNALTVLLGWVSEARASRASPADLERGLAIIEDRARSARDIARRAIGSQVVVEEREQEVTSVVRDVIEALSVEAQRARVDFVVDGQVPGVSMPLAADASQVLTNILMNALAWAPADSKVTIELESTPVGVEVTVRDEGPGVAPGQKDRIFNGATTREGGAGVGLKHARAVARAAGGDLDLVSDGASVGACFRVKWPRSEPPLPGAPVSSPRPAVLAGTRVLVVEDDVGVAMLLESALGARGADVIVARTASELAERAGDQHDAALIDLSPIAHDVAGAVELLRRGSPDVAIVFISGSSARLPDEMEEEGVRWVRKPFEIGEIVAALIDTRTTSTGRAGSETSLPRSSRTRPRTE